MTRRQKTRRFLGKRLARVPDSPALLQPMSVADVPLPSQGRGQGLGEAAIEAVIATCGAWVGLVDAEQLKRDLRDAQWDDSVLRV